MVIVAGVGLFFWLDEIRRADARRGKNDLSDRLGRIESEISFELTVVTAIFTYAIDDTAKEIATGNSLKYLADSIGSLYEKWRRSSRFPDLIDAIYFVDLTAAESSVLRFQTSDGRFLPGTVVEVKYVGDITQVDTDSSEYRLVLLQDELALVIPLEGYQFDSSSDKPGELRKRVIHAGDIVLRLGRDYFASTMVARLIESHLGTSGSGPYAVAVVAEESGRLLHSSPDIESADFAASESVDGAINLTGWGGSNGAFLPDLLPPRGGESAPGSVESRSDILSYRIKDLMVKQWFELSRTSSAKGTDEGSTERWEKRSIGVAPEGARPLVTFVDEEPRNTSVDLHATPKDIMLYVRHSAGSIDRHFRRIRNRRLVAGYAVLASIVGVAIVYFLLYRLARNLQLREHEFVATVTHELRTPVAAVQAVGDNLSEGIVTDPARVRSYGDAVLAHGRRLHNIIDKVLLYAGLSEFEIESKGEPIHIGDAVHAAISNLPGGDRERLIVHIEGNLPPAIVDLFAIETIVDNILSNAIKHTNDRSTITINAYRYGGNDAGAEFKGIALRVSDNGDGISRHELRRIREPFFRGAGSRKKQTPGSGLGLSLVNRIVHTLGWKLEIDSLVGRGTIVTVKLPVSFEIPQ